MLLLVPGRHRFIGEMIGMCQNGMGSEWSVPRSWGRRSRSSVNPWCCGMVDQH